MKLNPQSVCAFAILSLCCVLITGKSLFTYPCLQLKLTLFQGFQWLNLCCWLDWADFWSYYNFCAVRESSSTFIPGRCVCPKTQQGVRGQLKALKVLLPSSTCHNVTVMWVPDTADTLSPLQTCVHWGDCKLKVLFRAFFRVTLQRNNKSLCLNPEAPMAKQLIRCWLRWDLSVCHWSVN